MAVEGLGGGSAGLAFLVSAGVQYEIIAAACSSPQTTHVNAAKRADTLMFWVHCGIAQGVLFAAIAAMIDRKLAAPVLAGSALAIALLYAQYVYAKSKGLAEAAAGAEPTESY